MDSEFIKNDKNFIIKKMLNNLDDEIIYFKNSKIIKNKDIIKLIIQYYDNQKDIIIYMCNKNIDIINLNILKEKSQVIMTEILEKSSQDNDIYIGMNNILEDLCETINILCDKIVDIID